MTAAALRIRQGRIGEAEQFIKQARDAKWPGLFTACANDMTFRAAAAAHPELQDLLHVEGAALTFPDR